MYTLFYTKFRNFGHITHLSPVNHREVINYQITAVFWPTLYMDSCINQKNPASTVPDIIVYTARPGGL